MKPAAAAMTLLAGAMLSIAATLYTASLHLNHDVAGYLALSERFLGETRLYVDTLLPNQLSVVYLHSIPHLVSRTLSHLYPSQMPLSIADVFYAYVFVVLQACLFLCWRVLRDAPRVGEPLPRATIVAVLAAALFLLPLRDNNFGQREQLICAMIAPYFLLCLRHALESTRVRLADAIACGVLAALGASIKPHFLLFIAALELWLIFCKRDVRAWMRPEGWSFLAASSVYLCFWVFNYPEAFRLISPFATTYSAYGVPTSQKIATTVQLIILALPLAVLAIFPGPGDRDTYRHALGLGLVAITINLLIFFVQSGFYYQVLPIFLFELLVAIYAATLFSRRLIPIAVGAVIALLLGNDLRHAIPRNTEQAARLRASIEKIGPTLSGHRVMVLSTSMLPWYPLIVHTGASWTGPLWFLTYLQTAYASDAGGGTEPRYHTPEEMNAAERFYHEAIIRVLLEDPPNFVIVSTAKTHEALPGMEFDILKSFSADPRFALRWREYRIRIKGPRYAIYRHGAGSFKRSRRP